MALGYLPQCAVPRNMHEHLLRDQEWAFSVLYHPSIVYI